MKNKYPNNTLTKMFMEEMPSRLQKKVNKWLTKKKDLINIIDIKYTNDGDGYVWTIIEFTTITE